MHKWIFETYPAESVLLAAAFFTQGVFWSPVNFRDILQHQIQSSKATLHLRIHFRNVDLEPQLARIPLKFLFISSKQCFSKFHLFVTEFCSSFSNIASITRDSDSCVFLTTFIYLENSRWTVLLFLYYILRLSPCDGPPLENFREPRSLRLGRGWSST
jgi:hypothetical protein